MDKAKRKAIIAGNWKMNKTASEAAVHLPVASNDSLALCLIHDMFSLPSY